jgi:MFS family permease
MLLSVINDNSKLSQYHLAFITTIEYMGYTFSTILVNIVLQYLSNKRAIQIFAVLTLIFTGLSLTTLYFYYATLCRFFVGLCLGVIDVLVYINLIENIPTQIRGFISSIILIFFPLGQFLIAVFGYFMVIEDDADANFRYLLLIPFAFIGFIIILILFIQESPRRMIATNNIYEGVIAINRISTFNRRNTKDILERSNERKEVDKSFKGLFLHLFSGKYAKYTIIFWLLAFMTGFVFNGIFFMLPTTAPRLERSELRDVIKSVSLEIPSNFIASLLIDNKRIGRLLSLKVSYLISVIVCVSCFIAGEDYLIINCMLKFFITISSNILLVYCSESYETIIRAFGISSFNFWKRIGNIVSPFIITYLDYKLGNGYPSFYIFLPMTIACFGISLLLTVESRGKPLE